MATLLRKLDDPQRFVRAVCDMAGALGLPIGLIGLQVLLSKGTLTNLLQVQAIVVLALATVIGFRCTFGFRSDYRRVNYLLSLVLGLAVISTMSEFLWNAPARWQSARSSWARWPLLFC